jgi:hypothetical protein
MERKNLFADFAFLNLRWLFYGSILLLAMWLVVFMNDHELLLPVIENPVSLTPPSITTAAYTLEDIHTSATLGINTNFVSALFLSRPLFGLDMVSCLFIIFLMLLLYKIIKRVADGVVFKEKTYNLFYWASAGFLFYGLLSGLIIYFTNRYVEDLTNHQYLLKWSLVQTLMTGVPAYFFFSLGYSFKKGYLLQQEQDLTI